MKNIITIQHTQSIHHANGMIDGWGDWDLSELGIEQAERKCVVAISFTGG
jgi:probable phosphoglycerate mutase